MIELGDPNLSWEVLVALILAKQLGTRVITTTRREITE